MIRDLEAEVEGGRVMHRIGLSDTIDDGAGVASSDGVADEAAGDQQSVAPSPWKRRRPRVTGPDTHPRKDAEG